MRILVQKYGGTSLSTKQARARVIQHIKRALHDQYAVVVVVSAMGRNGEPYATDSLLALIHENGGNIAERDQDLLLSCGEVISATTMCSMLRSEGIKATVMTGGQAGIRTDNRFGDARILNVVPNRLLQSMQQGETVIVTGFQGVTEDGDVTTLGRGGSDTTATALGAALQAEVVEIYTDVDGVLTADPKIVPDATPLDRVSYGEVCNMANYGAKVIHPRAVEIAMHARIPLRVRSTFSDSEGTLVIDQGVIERHDAIKDRIVTGIAHAADITQIQVLAEDQQIDLQVQVFQAMAKAGISVDFINVNPTGVVYTVSDRDADRATFVLDQLGYQPKVQSNCAKVAVIGGGINGVPGIMSKIVTALAAHHITILQSADSNTTIWVLVQRSDMEAALRTLHEQFELAKVSE